MYVKKIQRQHVLRLSLLAAINGVVASTAQAQEIEESVVNNTAHEVVVQGGITYRNRTTAIEPVLSYDLEYFQRFEPTTAGDIIKRIPSAVFVESDIGEYDAVQLRGLDPGYTQVLVNGKKVPGAGDDRSFWVDRIPAEMIERVEILRSNSANRSGDAVAGALNIILRDSFEFEGSYLRAGAVRHHDGEIKPTLGGVTSFDAGPGSLLLGFNVQDRYNAKFKRSDRFSNPADMELLSFEDQVETKDGQDYSGNFSYNANVGTTGRMNLDGFYVKTDRDIVEVSEETEYDDGDVIVANVPGESAVDQDNWGLSFGAESEFAGGENQFDLAYAMFDDTSVESEEAHAYVDGEWDESEAESLGIDASDTELSFKLAHKRDLGFAEMEFGVDYRSKEREIGHTYYEWEAEDEGEFVVYGLDTVIDSTIEETRIDPYLQFSGGGTLSWEAGLRYETTDSDLAYVQDDDDVNKASQEYNELLPSLHLKWDINDLARINFSLAKSLRRPNFNHIIPAVLEEEYADNDFLGNPGLEPETAIGFDLGFEYRLGRNGIVGVNFFYRDVSNLIEMVNTGVPGVVAFEDFVDDYVDAGVEAYEEVNPDASDDMLDDLADGFEEEAEALAEGYMDSGNYAALDPNAWVYTMANVGDGKVMGVEFDMSTPLSFMGLDNTGVFLNYSWLDSEVKDFIGERRFNNQAKAVYNVGFIQNLPSMAASFGLTYRKQDDAFSRVVAEEVTTTYGGDLELFLEKRVGENFSVRLSANNLLDSSKDEFFHKFDNEQDQIDRDYDEYELETEEGGPRVQLVARWAF